LEVSGEFEKVIPLISICIPTYNRCEQVSKLVKDILCSSVEELEIIVLDNCSNDDTKQQLSTIVDSRLVFIRNEENIGGIFNILKSISLASGKFALLCLDKDYLDHNKISTLINRIQLDPEVVFGYCSLNIHEVEEDVIYESGFDSVMNMAYLSRHPSGMFYKTKEYKKLPILNEIFTDRKAFPFYTDLINAEMAMIGKSQIIKLPVFYTETKEEAVKTLSFTYDLNNVYFSPNNRIIEFDVYVQNAVKLSLSHYKTLRLMSKLYEQGLMSSTFGYKRMVEDAHVCLHNRISTQKVSKLYLWEINFKFSKHFFRKKLPINTLQKILIIFCYEIKFMLKIFLMK